MYSVVYYSRATSSWLLAKECLESYEDAEIWIDDAVDSMEDDQFDMPLFMIVEK